MIELPGKRVVFITGSRELARIKDRPWVKPAIVGASLVCHGGAAGADLIADDVAAALQIDTIVFRARWLVDGRKAGPIRNQRMADSALQLVGMGYDVVCHAFLVEGSKGTYDCVRRMKAAGIPVTVHERGEAKT